MMIRWNARLIAFVLACLLILVPSLLSLEESAGNFQWEHQHVLWPHETPGNHTTTIDVLQNPDEFETHLPIVVVDFYGEPGAPTVWSEEKGYRVLSDEDPYVEGALQLYDKKNGCNKLSDTPAVSTNMRVRLRGNSSLEFAKQQYLLKAYNPDGSKNSINMLDMGEDWEWVLNISYIDKSLLRNYMCLNIAGEIMGIAPRVRYCEVFEINNEHEYQYQGVYLLMGSVKQSVNRVDIAEYDPHFAESAYLLCRDRFEEDGIMLNTYATENELTSGHLGVRYPKEAELTDATLAYIEADISRFERALYAEDTEEFLKYRSYIDMQSFVDYFIINEFFANYDAGFNSFYLYKDIGGQLTLGPVWDFDQAIDNNQPMELKLNATAMHSGVWFDRMLRDGEFVRQIVNRYRELRQGVLSNQSISRYIDDAVAYLGAAQERDWSRWRYNDHAALYSDSPTGKVHPTLLSNTRDFPQEVNHIKSVLMAHGTWMDQNLESLYQFSVIEPGREPANAVAQVMDTVMGSGQAKWLGGSLALVFLVLFFISVHLVQRT